MSKKYPKGKKPVEESSLVIDEMRLITPGTQALLGFQFSAFFANGFEKLPKMLQYLHLGSLLSIALCTLLLMAPVPFHRITEEGENTKRLHVFASKMVLSAMFFLAIGMATDIYVVTSHTTNSDIIALIISISLVIIFYSCWFGYTAFQRQKK